MDKNHTAANNESSLNNSEIYKHFKNSNYLSIKLTSYFQVYEELLSKYKNKKIVFVEIGVFNGGSLFMWRDYFGPEARIIGLDFNPGAKKWEKDGFEIFIGNQSDPAFWDNFFATVGDVDVILDDGGHTNEQQIVTTHQCIPHIKDDGMLIVEDTHSSYLKAFGNPSKYSFMNYAKQLMDSINSRFPSVNASKNPLQNIVYSMSIYVSIVCFNINRKKCLPSAIIYNDGVTSDAVDFVYQDRFSKRLNDALARFFKAFGIKFSAQGLFRSFENIFINQKIKKYFD
jgi:hypothetical protein